MASSVPVNTFVVVRLLLSSYAELVMLRKPGARVQEIPPRGQGSSDLCGFQCGTVPVAERCEFLQGRV